MILSLAIRLIASGTDLPLLLFPLHVSEAPWYVFFRFNLYGLLKNDRTCIRSGIYEMNRSACYFHAFLQELHHGLKSIKTFTAAKNGIRSMDG